MSFCIKTLLSKAWLGAYSLTRYWFLKYWLTVLSYNTVYVHPAHFLRYQLNNHLVILLRLYLSPCPSICQQLEISEQFDFNTQDTVYPAIEHHKLKYKDLWTPAMVGTSTSLSFLDGQYQNKATTDTSDSVACSQLRSLFCKNILSERSRRY